MLKPAFAYLKYIYIITKPIFYRNKNKIFICTDIFMLLMDPTNLVAYYNVSSLVSNKRIYILQGKTFVKNNCVNHDSIC